MKFRKIVFITVFFSVLLCSGINASDSVTWIDFAQKNNPVARPLDKLILCVNGFVASKHFKSKITHEDDAEYGGVAQWLVEPKGGKNSGNAEIRTGFLEKMSPTPVGVRIYLSVPEPNVFRLKAYKGFSRRKGFYRAKLMGASTKIFKKGWQYCEIRWAKLGIKPEDYKLINGFGISLQKAPANVKIARIEIIFASEEDAITHKKQKDYQLRKMQETMLRVLEARGININAKTNKADDTEKKIWQGIELVALEEQIKVWDSLAKHNKIELKPNAKILLEKLQELTRNINNDVYADFQSKLVELRSQTEDYVDSAIAQIPIDKRRWIYGNDTRFYRPDGRPYRVFGPFFFRSIYTPDREPLLWRKWDFKYLSALGFNAIRLPIKWNGLEPTQGEFNEEYLSMLTDIMKEAERHGMGVSIDLHWPYPNWFKKGKPGQEAIEKLDKNNSYHWPEALQDSWGRIASRVKDIPNIVCFEIPTNETPIASNKYGVKASPVLMRYWNQWLRRTYKERSELEAAWNHSVKTPKQYSLKKDEDWDNNSILPLGFQNDISVDEAYLFNPRLQDHLRWVAYMQTMQTTGIMKEIRKSIPSAIGIFQRTIGDMWDHSPVPLNYRAIQTVTGEHVIAGTHYGMGSMQARKAATLSLASYDSEQQMENNFGAVKRQVKLGLGFCPFAFHYRGAGGMLLADDDWHLKKQVAYLAQNSDWIKNYWPEKKHRIKVGVITNSRLEATTGRVVDDAVKILEGSGCDVSVYESMRVINTPEIIKGNRLLITCSSYMDPRLLSALKNNYNGNILLSGRLDIDAFARTQHNGLSQELHKEKIFLKNPNVQTLAQSSAIIDLSGVWDWAFTGKKTEAPNKMPKNIKWKKMRVPSMWGEVGLTGSLEYRIGDGWYKKKSKIPLSMKGNKLFLQMGGVDDIDWVFFNGKLIASTTTETQNYWVVPRKYEIPNNLIRWGAENTITICVRNIRGDGGIWKSPIAISGNVKCKVKWKKRKTDLKCYPNMTKLNKSNLLTDVKVIASAYLDGGKTKFPAFIKHGRWYWWVGSEEWDYKSESDKNVLHHILKKIK